MRTRWRSLAILGFVAVILLAAAQPASAHATYKSSNPADESTVSSAPSQITAEFTEPMTGGSYMAVTDPCGRDSSSGSSQTGSSMSVGNTSTAAGTYSVFWRAVSIDGHTTVGTFTFTASGGEPCPGEEEENPGTTTGGGGGTGGSGSGSGGSGGSDDNGSTSASASGGNGSGDGGHSDRHSGKHGGGGKDRNGKDKAGGAKDETDGTTPVADSGPDAPEEPSALEGIPLGGLLITLAVAAFIGAAAGKIYVSLSGD